MSKDMGASPIGDRATHEQSPQAVSAVPVGIPSAVDFDLAFESAAAPEDDLSLEWILLGVDRKGEAFVLDADEGFYRVDLLPEFWACDNGIEYPDDLSAGLYLMAPVFIKTDIDGDPTFKGTIEPLCLAAQAIEARRAETGTGSVVDESTVPEGNAPISPRQNISDVLIEALTKAAVWFEEYAFQHGCKATQTADDAERVSRLGKSKRNKERAEYLRDALRQAKGGEG